MNKEDKEAYDKMMTGLTFKAIEIIDAIFKLYPKAEIPKEHFNDLMYHAICLSRIFILATEVEEVEK